MDSRLEQALDFANFRIILATRQKNLKKLFDNKLIFHYNSGIFKATPELLTFVHMLIDMNLNSFLIIDENHTPIEITVADFFESAFEKYSEAIKQYYESYKKLNEAREIRKAVDWEHD